MKSFVTSKGQVTIPKQLREQFGIEHGAEVYFVTADDGILLRKVVDRQKQSKVLGCLKTELEGRAIPDLLDELRGPVELPPKPSELSSDGSLEESRRKPNAAKR